MEQQFFRRVQIAGLSIFGLFGLVAHMLMFVMELPINIVLGVDTTAKVNEMIESAGGSIDGLLWMIEVFIILALVPVFLPLVSNAKWAKWVTLIIAAFMALMNIVDGALHMFAHGEIPQGLATLLISGGGGVAAFLFALKWIRE